MLIGSGMWGGDGYHYSSGSDWARRNRLNKPSRQQLDAMASKPVVKQPKRSKPKTKTIKQAIADGARKGKLQALLAALKAEKSATTPAEKAAAANLMVSLSIHRH